MAGPEPYPQVKWTRDQENAYAEGRASAKGETSKGGPAPRSGSKRKRYVRTQAGANRYHVPIGAEIGQARNAKAAESQKDTESTDRYGQLVGADARAQAEAMQSLNDSQVQRLAQVAYSFKSSNPDVVRLRMGVAAELKRRGFNVNDFGGLGGGSTRPAVSAKKKPVSASSSPTGGYYRMVRERKLSVPQLRKALGVFSKIGPDKRQVVARYLVGQAIELGVPHMLGRSVVELATPDQQRVIELSGSWKHGWIPLNATAVSEKMKGKTGGKQWWTTGGVRTNKPRASVAVPKDTSGSHKTGLTHGQGVPSNARTGGRYAPISKKRKPGVKGNAETMRRSVEAGKQARAKREARQEIAAHNRKAVENRTSPTGGRAFLDRKAAENKGKPLGYTVHKQDGSSEFVRTGTVTGSSRGSKAGPAEKRNTVAPNEAQERQALNTLKQRLARVGGDENRLSPKERDYLKKLRAKFEGNSGKA